jgi:cytochrome c oxidase subunit 2
MKPIALRMLLNRSASRCLAVVLSAFLFSGIAYGQEAPDLAAGEKLWKFCAFCHGADGFGQERSEAPKLAGDAAWYTERQLRHFRNRTRGDHPEDMTGIQMIVYSVPLVNEKAIRDMAAFIETMPVDPENPAPDRMRNRPRERPFVWESQFAVTTTEQGADAVAGEKIFAACAVCHGESAEGNRELNAPRLDNKQDWYLVRQLKYFKYGARGVHEDDVYGKQMAELGSDISDQQMVDVVAYIMTLSKGPFY